MSFFKQFPKIQYDLLDDIAFLPKTVTNVLFRLKLIDAIKNNVFIYYPYYVKDGEKMEDIAYKYYKDSSKHWVIAISNDIIDPQYDWPLSYSEFINYMNNKYGSLDVTYTTIDHYEMLTTTENSDGTTNTFISIIDENTYNTTPNYYSEVINLNDGTTVTITTTTNIVYVFDYEFNLNEQKKQINLIDVRYIDQIQQEFETLTMNAQ